jgi:hypothetical protein
MERGGRRKESRRDLSRHGLISLDHDLVIFTVTDCTSWLQRRRHVPVGFAQDKAALFSTNLQKLVLFLKLKKKCIVKNANGKEYEVVSHGR